MTDHDRWCPRFGNHAGSDVCICESLVQAREEQNEKIAQAIEASEIRLPWGPTGAEMVSRSQAARIARNGGRDE